MKPLRLWLACLLACLIGVLSPAMASTGQQSPTTIITMTAPEYLSSLYRNTIIPAFEEENPDIRVEFVFTEQNYYGDPIAADAEQQAEYFENLATYATSADVLHVGSYVLNPYATATGFFLDLAPLVNTDNTLQTQDFYPAAWQAFQWDGGMWALPYAVNLQVLTYNKTMFDEAGVNYPNESWQIVDFINAAEALQTFDSQGRVRLSPLTALNPALFTTPIVGNFYDEGTIPNQPDYTHPALTDALAVWIDYYQRYEMAPLMGYSFNEIPMSLSFPYQMAQNSFMEDSGEWDIALPPGGRAFTQSEGFAISRGASNPEAAYRFLTFVTQSPDLLANSFGGYPARRSLADAEPSENLFVSRPEFEPDVQAFLDDALENAIPASELRFSGIFYQVQSEVEANGVDIATALETLQERAISALEEAQTYQSTPIVVESPVLREVAPDQVVLNFGLNTMGSFNARRQQWADLVDEFSSMNPRVGDIVINEQIYGPDGLDTTLDCYFDGSGLSHATAPPEQLLALDPLINADPNFNPDDFWPGVLSQVQVENGTYGYPIVIQPMIMRVNENKFEQAGLPIPEGSWTANDFAVAVEAFQRMEEDPDRYIIANNTFGVSGLMMLISSYGGLPIDYRTDPATYDLTSAQTLAAVGQIVDYIRQGAMAYDSPISRSTRSMFFIPNDDQYIIIDSLGGYNTWMDNTSSRIVSFPIGDYAPIAYQVGAVYIFSTSQHVEACYDWITTLATQPELFEGMPSRQSSLDDPAFIATQGAESIAFYRAFGQTLTAPNVIRLPSAYGGLPSSSPGAFLEPNFFYHALDNVIFNDADLANEMAQAEENLSVFRGCVDDIEQLPVEELQARFADDQEGGMRYYRQFVDCGVAIIPELRESYSFYYQDDN